LQSSSEKFPNSSSKRKLADDVEDVSLTEGMRLIKEYTEGLANRLLEINVSVEFVSSKKWKASACYGNRLLTFNVGQLGTHWFSEGATDYVDRLIVHELAHQFASNHYSQEYFDGICVLAARMKVAVLKDPEWFKKFVK
jgi:hypothetical protein